MTKPNNLQLSGKFLWLTIEAVEQLIAKHQSIIDNPNSTDEELARIDYGNDATCLKIIHKELIQAEQTENDIVNEQTLDMPINPLQKWNIIKEDICITMQPTDVPLTENEELLFSFEAESYIRAMEIRNKFLDFGPYIPLSENIVGTRELTLFDENENPVAPVKVIIYQPVKVEDGRWNCEYHINIEDTEKPESLGGYNTIGFDTTQAIQNAFLIIDSIILDYNNSNNHKIFWLEYGKDCGFKSITNV